MTTTAVADRLIALCKESKFIQAQQELYHTDIISIDPDGSRTIGLANMQIKEQTFLNRLEKIISVEYSTLLVAGSYFTVILRMEIDIKNVGNKIIEEVCLYQVKDGKIVFEQFFRDLPPFS